MKLDFSSASSEVMIDELAAFEGEILDKRVSTTILSTNLTLKRVQEAHWSWKWKESITYQYQDLPLQNEETILQPTLPLRRPLAAPMYSFGTTLRKLRHQRGLSQSDLAQTVGVDISYISKLENGHVSPPSEHLFSAFADQLDVDIDQLLLSAGKLPKDLVQMLVVNSVAQQFMKEAFNAQLDTRTWNELLQLLRDKIRRDTLYTSTKKEIDL